MNKQTKASLRRFKNLFFSRRCQEDFLKRGGGCQWPRYTCIFLVTLLHELNITGSLNFPGGPLLCNLAWPASISIKFMNYHLYTCILQTSRKKSPLDKVFYSQLFHTDSNKANVVGLKAWMNC